MISTFPLQRRNHFGDIIHQGLALALIPRKGKKFIDFIFYQLFRESSYRILTIEEVQKDGMLSKCRNVNVLFFSKSNIDHQSQTQVENR